MKSIGSLGHWGSAARERVVAAASLLAMSAVAITLMVSASAARAEPTLDEGIVGVHWLTRKELDNPERRLRSPMVLRCIDDLCDGARFPLSCLRHLETDPSAPVRRS